jgi:hypothetical protein
MSQLTNAGYGSTPGWEAREGIYAINPGLQTKLESLPKDLANGLVAQAVALADAQGARSMAGQSFLDAITNISN